MVFQRNFLGPQVFLDRHRVVGAALDRGIVGQHQALDTGHPADAGDDTGAGGGILVHAEGGQCRNFQKRTAGVQQGPYALARQQFAAILVFLARAFGSSECSLSEFFSRRFIGQLPMVGIALAEFGVLAVDLGFQPGHGSHQLWAKPDIVACADKKV